MKPHIEVSNITMQPPKKNTVNPLGQQRELCNKIRKKKCRIVIDEIRNIWKNKNKRIGRGLKNLKAVEYSLCKFQITFNDGNNEPIRPEG